MKNEGIPVYRGYANPWMSQPKNEAIKPTGLCRIVSQRKFGCYIGETALQLFDDTNQRTAYEVDLSCYLPRLGPALTKSGKVAARQPPSIEMTKHWWEAQCGFRGLDCSGTIAEMQNLLRTHGNIGLGSAVQQAFDRMRHDFVELIWNQKNDDDKAALWPRHFLWEALGPNGSRRDQVIVVRTYDYGHSVIKAAKALNISYDIETSSLWRTTQRRVALAHNELHVRSKFAETSRQEHRALDRWRHEREISEAADKSAIDEFKTTFDLAKQAQKESKDLWNIRGPWVVLCPYIQSQWPDEGVTYSMELKITEPDGDGNSQMNASFDFGIYKGDMQFRVPSRASSSVPHSSQTSRAQPLSHAWQNYKTLPTSPFSLQEISLPSLTSRDFEFLWDGIVTGDCEDESASDRGTCTLKFESPYAITGIFTCDEVEQGATFEGFKKDFRSDAIRKQPGSEAPSNVIDLTTD